MKEGKYRLTLEIDADVVGKIKAICVFKGMSLTNVTENFYKQLINRNSKYLQKQLGGRMSIDSASETFLNWDYEPSPRQSKRLSK